MRPEKKKKKNIKSFKIIEHYINKEYDIECGIYCIDLGKGNYYIVQTGNNYSAIGHLLSGNELFNVKKEIIEEIKDLLNKE